MACCSTWRLHQGGRSQQRNPWCCPAYAAWAGGQMYLLILLFWTNRLAAEMRDHTSSQMERAVHTVHCHLTAQRYVT